MKYLLFALLMLTACSEGLKLPDTKIQSWFESNYEELQSIVDIFAVNKCLRRVELSSSAKTTQRCENQNIERDIATVQGKLRALDLVLATGGTEKGSSIYVSVLLYRHRPNDGNMSHAVKIFYDELNKGNFMGRLGCVIFPLESAKGWYVWHLDANVECN